MHYTYLFVIVALVTIRKRVLSRSDVEHYFTALDVSNGFEQINDLELLCSHKLNKIKDSERIPEV